MEDNTKEFAIITVILIFILFFALSISSCRRQEEELKIEQTKIFLDRGCEQVIIPDTVSRFYWSNCKK